MENHPIPQDVTGFKFKLIGSVTVKQFLYLLGFGILATVAFILPLNIFIKVPAMLTFALMGISLTFVPLEGRPMDIMLVNFAKAIPRENRYIFRKRGANLGTFEVFKTTVQKTSAVKSISAQTSSQDARRAALLSTLRRGTVRVDDSETKFLKNIKSLYEEGAQVVPASPENSPTSPTAVSLPLAAGLPRPSPEPGLSPPPKQETSETVRVRFIPQNATLNAGFPTLPDVPNIVMGKICDARGRTLPNVLVEVVDSNNIPVRAFKTNALGQFAAATALADGKYKVYFDDPKKQHEFETIEITLASEIFSPLEITSIDSRERLRRDLFGNQMIAS